MNKLMLLVLTVCAPAAIFATKNEPLVLLEESGSYRFPHRLDDIKESRLISFCPLETQTQDETDEYLLGPKKNEGIFCNKPVKALLKPSEELNITCGSDNKSFYLDFVYRILLNNEVGKKAKFKELLAYRICYDRSNQRTTYTYFPMISPAVLENGSLTTTKSKTFDMSTEDYKFLLDRNELAHLHKEYNKLRMSLNKLKPLMLVSPHDMAFPALKKSTYHYINTVPAWTNVIEMWDVINAYLRNIAIDVAKDNNNRRVNLEFDEQNMIQMSGWMGHSVINQRLQTLDNEQKIAVPEFIWKLAYIRKEEKIVAILLRNIPDSTDNEDNKPEDKLCDDKKYNLKIEELKKMRPKIKWEKFVQFCDSSFITDLFHLPENLDFLMQKEYLLPLVMTYSRERDEYQLPQTYTGLELLSADTNKRPTQTLFCPIENELKEVNDNPCLVFNNNKDPYCKRPVEPFNKPSASPEVHCNADQRHYFYDRIYEMCRASKQIQSEKKNEREVSKIGLSPFKQVVFSYCADATTAYSTIFTYHKIISPGLLKNKYLKKERELSYESYSRRIYKLPDRVMFEDVDYPYAIRETYIKYFFGPNQFKQLHMVPPDDMAFPLYKKATYHTKNMTYAWENIVTVYNIIHQRLRLLAIKKNQELIQINGVRDKLELPNRGIIQADRGALPKYIWTVVYNPDKTESIAIVIHNIPDKHYSNEVDRLCEPSTCRIQEWDLDMSTDLASFAYCCDAEVITQLYNFPNAEGEIKIEALFWPLVLIHYHGKYQYPESFNGLDEPADDPEQKQINFCPAEDDEFCIIPNEGVIPYCTKSTKYVWIRNENSNGCMYEDMVDFSVVFQLCSKANTKMNNLEIFRVCYDVKNKRTLFTYHQLISPALMNKNDLQGQRRKQFPWDTNDHQLLNYDFKILENAFETKKSGIFEEIADKQSVEKLTLTSPYQMPFASLIEPTYHYVNVIPAWREVVNIWNAIDQHILSMALTEKQKFIHVNGSSEDILETQGGKKIYLDDNQLIPMSKYIWKVLYDQEKKRSVAFIIHNWSHDKILQPKLFCEPRVDLCNFKWQASKYSSVLYPATWAYCCKADVITDKYNLPKVGNSLIVGDIRYYAA